MARLQPEHRPDPTGSARPSTGEEAEVDSHPTFDLDTHYAGPLPLILSRRTEELIGARYLGERQVIHPDTFRRRAGEPGELSDGDLGAISSDESGQRWIVSFTHDRAPHLTYFYDHSTGAAGCSSGRIHIWIPRAGAEDAVTITARDGLDCIRISPPGGSSRRTADGPVGPRWTVGRDCWGMSRTCSFWPTAVMRCCRSTFAARPVTASRS